MRALLPLTLLAALLAGSSSMGFSLAIDAAPPPTTIRGRVVDARGRPVRGAVVYLVKTTWDDETTTLVKRIRVGKSGRFVCKAPNAGEDFTYSYLAWAPGTSYGGLTRGEMSRATNGDLRLIVYPEWKLKGTVSDENGRPVAGAKVALTQYHGYKREPYISTTIPAGLPAQTATTGRDGTFTVGKLIDPRRFDAAYAMIKVTAKGRATVDRALANGMLQRPVNVIQPAEAVVEGTLFLPDSTGAAPAGTKMTLKYSQDLGRPLEVKVDRRGRFRFDALQAGKAMVMLGDSKGGEPLPWALPAVTYLNLESGTVKKLDLVLTQGALIKGVALDKGTGKPIADSEIVVCDAGGEGVSDGHNVHTDDKGAFTVRVAAGKVSFASTEWSYYSRPRVEQTTLTLADGEVRTGVELRINQMGPYDAMDKPAPPGFELKTGTYQLTWDPELDCSELGSPDPAFVGAGVLFRLKGKPEFKSKKPRMEAYRLDGKDNAGLLAVAMDESRGTSKGYDTLYVDCNRNLDLADDSPIKMLSDGGSPYSDWITVQCRQGTAGDETRNPVRMQFRLCDHGTSSHIIASRSGGWVGRVDTSTVPVECVCVDLNQDGVYGRAVGVSSADALFIDTNGLGVALLREGCVHHVPLRTTPRIGDRFYSLSASPSGETITVGPYTGPTGSVLVRASDIGGLSGPATAVSLASTEGLWQFVDLKDKPVVAPTGKAKLTACEIALKLGSKTIPISCELSRPMELLEGSQQTVEIAGKLTAAISPGEKTLRWKQGSTETLEWPMKIGRDITVTSLGGDQRKAPTVRLLDNKGRVVATKQAGFT